MAAGKENERFFDVPERFIHQPCSADTTRLSRMRRDPARRPDENAPARYFFLELSGGTGAGRPVTSKLRIRWFEFSNCGTDFDEQRIGIGTRHRFPNAGPPRQAGAGYPRATCASSPSAHRSPALNHAATSMTRPRINTAESAQIFRRLRPIIVWTPLHQG